MPPYCCVAFCSQKVCKEGLEESLSPDTSYVEHALVSAARADTSEAFSTFSAKSCSREIGWCKFSLRRFSSVAAFTLCSICSSSRPNLKNFEKQFTSSHVVTLWQGPEHYLPPTDHYLLAQTENAQSKHGLRSPGTISDPPAFVFAVLLPTFSFPNQQGSE